MWRVVDTAKAVFKVDNYKEYLSLQCDSAVRNIVRIYPYDVAQGIDTTGDGLPDEGSLRGSSSVVAERIRKEIQEKVDIAGIEILEAKITYLAYAPEIAAVMGGIYKRSKAIWGAVSRRRRKVAAHLIAKRPVQGVLQYAHGCTRRAFGRQRPAAAA